MAKATKELTVKLVYGLMGCTPRQRQTVKGLGLGRTNSTRTLKDTPETRGMIHQVRHLVQIVEKAK